MATQQAPAETKGRGKSKAAGRTIDLTPGTVQEPRSWRTQWLVSRLQVLLQVRRLKLPMGHETELLIRELQDYEVSISQSGHASFNARSGAHDDLVIALGLSVGTGDMRAEVLRYTQGDPPLGTPAEHRRLSSRH